MKGLDGSPNPAGSESGRRERENTLTVTTQPVVTCFVISLLPYPIHDRVHRSSDYGEQDWYFALRTSAELSDSSVQATHCSSATHRDIELTSFFQSDASRDKEFNC